MNTRECLLFGKWKTGRIFSAHRLFLYFIYTMPRSVVLIIYNPGIYCVYITWTTSNRKPFVFNLFNKTWIIVQCLPSFQFRSFVVILSRTSRSISHAYLLTIYNSTKTNTWVKFFKVYTHIHISTSRNDSIAKYNKEEAW